MLAVTSLVGGVLALLVGGELLVVGAAELARRLGVSPLVAGLTVVAFGTSLPELAVSVSAALGGAPAIAFGNVVGSNIANIGLVAGLAALLRPLDVHDDLLARELPIMVGLSLLVPALALFGGAPGFSGLDGAVLVVAFVVTLTLTVRAARRARTDVRPPDDGTPVVRAPLLRLLVGLAVVVGGAELTVRGAVGVADALGMSRTLVGLTIVAVGTSLPELVTTLVAVRKGQTDIALGAVVGSNVFNATAILGTTALIRPVPLPAGGTVDLCVMLAFAVALLPFARTGRRVVRAEGALLLGAYIGYVVWRALQG